jgi:CheY-like chemotaxis protein
MDEEQRPLLPVLLLACPPTWRMILEGEGFDVTWRESPEAALETVDGPAPVALVSGVLAGAIDRRRWAVRLRTMDRFRRIPWIVVAEEADDDLLDALEAGADDFVLAASESGLLGLRLRALVRMAERLRAAPDVEARTATGTIGEGGTLPLLRYCESHRLTGRLTVEDAAGARWVTFQRGELLGAGPEGASDPLEDFLRVKTGTYVIEQVQLGLVAPGAADADARPRAVDDGAAARRDTSDEAPALPPGSLSRVECRGQSFQIQTEGRNQPNFTVTTIVDRDGRTVRKIESGWPHPLQSAGDSRLAREAVEHQHQQVVRKLREMDAMERKEPEAASDPVVTGTLLTWAAFYVVEHVCNHLGTTITDSLLRRTRERVLPRHPALGSFQVGGVARVELDSAHAAQSGEPMIAAMSHWIQRFLYEARQVREEAGDVAIRQTTVLMEGPLEKIGFYRIFDQAGPLL